MKHIYYKNDFAVEITLLNASGEVVSPPDWKWHIEFTDGRRKYICSVDKGNANVVGNTIMCYLDNHKFCCGEIGYKFVQAIPDLNYLDGFQNLITPKSLPIELWEQESDNDVNIQSSVVPAYVVYDAYMTAKANGYTGTAEEFYDALNHIVDINKNEAERVEAEANRVTAEQQRVENFAAMESALTTATSKANTSTIAAEQSAERANTASDNADVATSNATQATTQATAATKRANDISADLEAKREADYWRGSKGDKGDKGDTGAKGDRGEKGDQGERGLQGVQGVKGDDGVSPTVTTSKTGNVTTIEITDAYGVHTATVNDGESVDVVQSTGTSETAVMSQKAVSNIVDELESQVIYDVTANNSGATFDSLSALLSNENLSTLIPTSVRHGGMSIRFVQSSDNKYVQYRLMTNAFSTTESDWQGVDDEPTAGSNNLVKSGGVKDVYYNLSSILYRGEFQYDHKAVNSYNGAVNNTPNASWSCTGYIYIENIVDGQTSIVLYRSKQLAINETLQYGYITFFDNDKNLIGSTFDNNVTVVVDGDYVTVTDIPSNTRYIRVNGYDKNSRILKFSLRDTIEDIKNSIPDIGLAKMFLAKDGTFIKPEEVTTSNGVYIDTSGVEHGGAPIGTTSYVPVFGLDYVFYTGKNNGYTTVPSVSWYDENFSYVGYYLLPSVGPYTRLKINVPSTAYYARFSAYITNTAIDKFAIEVMDTASLPMWYMFLAKTLIDRTDAIEYSINILGYYGHAIYQTKGINEVGNVLNLHAAWACSDYIDITGIDTTNGLTLVNARKLVQGSLSASYAYMYFYDSSKTLLGYSDDSYTTVSGNTVIITNIPANTKYIRFNAWGGKFAYLANKNLSSKVGELDNRITKIEDNYNMKQHFSMATFQKFAVIGDSYASGEINWDDAESPSGHSAIAAYDLSWGQVLARKNGVTCINMSKGGLTTKTWLTDNKGLALLNSSDAQNLYLIALGLNDANNSTPIGTVADLHEDSSLNPDTFYGNYGKIIDAVKIKAPNAKIILITTFRNTGNFVTINSAIKAIANYYSLPCVVTRDDPFMSSDYYLNNLVWSHPTAYLYSCMATCYERLISRVMYDNPQYFNDYKGDYQ